MSSILTEAQPACENPAINDHAWSEMTTTLLRECYLSVRQTTESLASSLSAEDQNLQSMPEASPVKWHRAHTSWFFETFILASKQPGYRPFDARFTYLYNSYYNGIGEQFPRAQRSLLSRPDCDRIRAYREHVDQAMLEFLGNLDTGQGQQIAPLVALGLNHEQQHQELIVTDLKHAFSHNPAGPAFTPLAEPEGAATEADWVEIKGGLTRIGSSTEKFCFDNETPSHPVFVADFLLASRPVNCGEYLNFIEDGGYCRPDFWLADGWDWIRREKIKAPLYWNLDDSSDRWKVYTLGGQRELDPAESVCHISFYEAFAYAQWAGARLPSEAEWETAVSRHSDTGHFADSGRLHPGAAKRSEGVVRMFGDVWEWTGSSYAPYPGFQPARGAVGEYNGKFMANQMVLRGGSCATPAGHIRPGYRNFFYPGDRWQFSGLRLARDCRT